MKSRWTSVVVVVGIAVAALVVAVFLGMAFARGNTPSSRADYQAAVVAARDRVDFALGRLSKAQSVDELLKRMDEAAAVIDDQAAGLDDVNAPDGLETEHARLVRHLETLAVDVKSTADQARQPGYEELLFGGHGLSFDSWDEINKVLAELKAQGIEVEPLSRHST